MHEFTAKGGCHPYPYPFPYQFQMIAIGRLHIIDFSGAYASGYSDDRVFGFGSGYGYGYGLDSKMYTRPMSPLNTHSTATAEETEKLGEGVARELGSGAVVLLHGELASGKTTLVRGLLRGLGGDPESVTSPSFVLVQSYPCRSGGIRELHHVDLYRLAEDPAALREIGLEELLSDPRAAVAVEWPKDAILTWLPADARCWRIELEHGTGDRRRITIEAPEIG